MNDDETPYVESIGITYKGIFYTVDINEVGEFLIPTSHENLDDFETIEEVKRIGNPWIPFNVFEKAAAIISVLKERGFIEIMEVKE